MNGYHENSHESINPLRILRIAFSVSCQKTRMLRMSRGFTAISHLLVVKRLHLQGTFRHTSDTTLFIC